MPGAVGLISVVLWLLGWSCCIIRIHHLWSGDYLSNGRITVPLCWELGCVFYIVMCMMAKTASCYLVDHYTCVLSKRYIALSSNSKLLVHKRTAVVISLLKSWCFHRVDGPILARVLRKSNPELRGTQLANNHCHPLSWHFLYVKHLPTLHGERNVWKLIKAHCLLRCLKSLVEYVRPSDNAVTEYYFDEVRSYSCNVWQRIAHSIVMIIQEIELPCSKLNDVAAQE